MAKGKKAPVKSQDFCWVIAYINSAYIDFVYKDLKKSKEYDDVEVYIPTVKILKKTFKGEQHFEEVPLLFNYGFFKIPRKFAVHSAYLENMKKNINCIYAWVRDPAKVLSTKPRLRADNKPVYDGDIPVATANSEEIAELVKAAYYSSVYDEDEIDRLNPGMVITLRGYPFENMVAEVVEVYPKKQKVKMKIEMFDTLKEVMVSFDNIFFTVYHNKSYDDSIILAQSIDITSQIDKSHNNGKTAE